MQTKGQRHRFNRIHLFYSYFLNNILSQEGVRAYWSLVFNLLFAPSLHQLSLLCYLRKSLSFYSSPTQTWYYIYSRPLHLLINYSIATYYEDRQIYDKRSTGAFLKVYFQAQREFIWKCFCICLLASCSLWCIIVHFLYYSSGYLKKVFSMAVNSNQASRAYTLWSSMATLSIETMFAFNMVIKRAENNKLNYFSRIIGSPVVLISNICP